MWKSIYLYIYLLINVTNVYAASGDSVMIAPTITTAPSMSYKPSVASSGNVYSYTSTTEYQTSVCPSGLTVNGSSIYNSAQRQIIYSYLGSQLVGSQVTAWTDIDTDCIGTQSQVIACPAGYSGTITQQRKVGTATGGYVYGDWTTTASNCVATAKPAGTWLGDTYERVYYTSGSYRGLGLHFGARSNGNSDNFTVGLVADWLGSGQFWEINQWTITKGTTIVVTIDPQAPASAESLILTITLTTSGTLTFSRSMASDGLYGIGQFNIF